MVEPTWAGRVGQAIVEKAGESVTLFDMTAMASQTIFTPDDLLRLEGEDKLYELIHGQLVEKDMSVRSNYVKTEVARLLSNAARASASGLVIMEQEIICFPWDPNHAPRPDIVFVKAGRLPPGDLPDGHLMLAPDLCVEVTSPNDRFRDVENKISDYLRAGVQVIWIVVPELRHVRVHRADGTVDVYQQDKTVVLPTLIPNFSSRVGDFFPPL